MYYLKCNHCGHLNEVNSEYMVFCTNCKKKIENNYSNWKKKNQDKTLDEFKKLICISDEDIQTATSKSKNPKKTLVYWITFISVSVIFTFVGRNAVDSLRQIISTEKTPQELLEAEWFKETFELGITIEVPLKLTKSELPIPEEVKEVIDQMYSYGYESKNSLTILVNSIKYNPIIGGSDLQGAANGSINEMKMQKGVTDFNYSEDSFEKSNIPGFLHRGNFKLEGIAAEFVNVGFAKDLNLWQVVIIFPEGDEVGRIIANRIVESVELKPIQNE